MHVCMQLHSLIAVLFMLYFLLKFNDEISYIICHHSSLISLNIHSSIYFGYACLQPSPSISSHASSQFYPILPLQAPSGRSAALWLQRS